MPEWKGTFTYFSNNNTVNLKKCRLTIIWNLHLLPRIIDARMEKYVYVFVKNVLQYMQYYFKRFLSYFSHSKTNSFYNEQYYVNSILFLYLGFLMKDSASSRLRISGMKRRRHIFIRSQWAFLGSAMMPAKDASGSSPYREGTGPAMMSPSKRAASAGQELRSMTGMLSLKQYKDSS